jgi:N-acetylglutamate synthase-like GNAT family acetyltransferase
VSTFIRRFLRRSTLTRPFTFSLCKLGTQGHIEDIAIKADQQGKKFGVKLLQALDYIAENVGCYKVCDWSIVLGLFTDVGYRPFSTAPLQMRDFTSSVDMKRQDLKCTITIVRKL